ncbi:MAG: RNA polymerase sigma-70 factor [Ferruginibacter sp.]
MLSEEEILLLQNNIADNGDARSFGQLYVAYMHRLLQLALSIIKNKELAEEIVSDVFIRLWQNRRTLKKISNLRLYLYVSTKNTALNYLSRHFRKDTISLDEMSLNMPVAGYNPEELLITSEAVRRIESAIQKLPPRCKLIFKLIKEDRLKYNEIAQLLDISVKTIDAQLAIALKKISSAVAFELKHSK